MGLGAQVASIVRIGRDDQRQARGDADAERLEAGDLARVVGHQLDRLHAERVQHVGGDAVVALVVAEAQGLVGLDGVEAVVLQLVGADLVGQADAAALLAQVEQDAVRHRRELAQGGLQLVAAVAAQRADDVAGEALRVEPHRHVLAVDDVLAMHEGGVLLAVGLVGEGDHVVGTEARRQVGRGGDPHAHVLRAVAVTGVRLVALQQCIEPGLGHTTYSVGFVFSDVSLRPDDAPRATFVPRPVGNRSWTPGVPPCTGAAPAAVPGLDAP